MLAVIQMIYGGFTGHAPANKMARTALLKVIVFFSQTQISPSSGNSGPERERGRRIDSEDEERGRE